MNQLASLGFRELNIKCACINDWCPRQNEFSYTAHITSRPTGPGRRDHHTLLQDGAPAHVPCIYIHARRVSGGYFHPLLVYQQNSDVQLEPQLRMSKPGWAHARTHACAG
jgi:hypothetical protein